MYKHLGRCFKWDSHFGNIGYRRSYWRLCSPWYTRGLRFCSIESQRYIDYRSSAICLYIKIDMRIKFDGTDRSLRMYTLWTLILRQLNVKGTLGYNVNWMRSRVHTSVRVVAESMSRECTICRYERHVRKKEIFLLSSI